MRRALLVAALALLLALDIAVVSLTVAIILHGGASAHGSHPVRGGLFSLLVVTVLGWLTVEVVTRLRSRAPEVGAGRS